MKKIVIAILLFAAAGAGLFVVFRGSFTSSAPTYRTAEIRRGDVVSVINATGTAEPEEVVDVGAQVAGMILSFGKDSSGKTIDYGSQVDENMVLATIDDTLYAADDAQAKAQLDSAKAGVERAKADLEQLKAKMVQAKNDWERAQRLGSGDIVSQSSYDAYKAAYDSAVANVAVGEAAIGQAQADVPQAQAALQRSQRNLGLCVIRSPVKGVIVDRRVNIGQTVVSSLNTPSLFLLAKDLNKMQVWASVNEADISSIHSGQAATFTVDAYPGRTFKGEVIKVRLNASMTQNVVTYTVEIAADNSKGLLLPYLTANVNFIVSSRESVLTVPNIALRWTPSPDRVEPGSPSAGVGAAGAGAGSGTTGSGAAPASGAQSAASGASGAPTGARPGTGPRAPRAPRPGSAEGVGTVWVTSGSYVRPVQVKTGLSDGTNTEISGPDLSEGLAVVVGEERKDSAAARASNPFTPQLNRGGPGGGAGGAGRGGAGGR